MACSPVVFVSIWNTSNLANSYFSVTEYWIEMNTNRLDEQANSIKDLTNFVSSLQKDVDSVYSWYSKAKDNLETHELCILQLMRTKNGSNDDEGSLPEDELVNRNRSYGTELWCAVGIVSFLSCSSHESIVLHHLWPLCSLVGHFVWVDDIWYFLFLLFFIFYGFDIGCWF